jgi:Insertion element 4 transposase N-terminal/Transposase DDE domain
MARQPIFHELQQLPTDERARALERIIPLAVVQEVLEHSGHARRHCPRLPHWFMVYFVLGLGLFAKDCYRQIYKNLQRFRKGVTPSRNTLGEARKGLGIAPIRLLRSKIVRLLATPEHTPDAFYADMRLMALDGFVLDVPDTPDNARIFGKPQSGRAEGAFPQARVLALCETGTHVLYQHLIKPCRRGEVSMTAYLLRWLEQDMLLLWDRNFLSYKHLQMIKARDAHLLARLKSNYVFAPIAELPDGSYLSKMYPSSWHRKMDRNGILVRIIVYTLDDPNRPHAGTTHRLLTTLLDAEKHPAEELIVLYHQRWEEELTIEELKTHQQERPVLRSQTPAGVIQEVEGLLLAHYAVRTLMFEAAGEQGVDPRRLSFTATLKILRRRLAEVPKNPKDHAGRKRWWEDLVAEVGEEVLPPRRDRINPRVIKQKMSKWAKKRTHHRRPPQPTKSFRDSIVIT